MSDMLTRYNESTAQSVKDARAQSEGDKAVNYFDMKTVYQDNFTTGAATPGDDPTGNFTDDALEHYDQEVTELANSHHKYNSSNTDSHYVNQNLNALGTIYQHAASEK